VSSASSREHGSSRRQPRVGVRPRRDDAHRAVAPVLVRQLRPARPVRRRVGHHQRQAHRVLRRLLEQLARQPRAEVEEGGSTSSAVRISASNPYAAPTASITSAMRSMRTPASDATRTRGDDAPPPASGLIGARSVHLGHGRPHRAKVRGDLAAVVDDVEQEAPRHRRRRAFAPPRHRGCRTIALLAARASGRPCRRSGRRTPRALRPSSRHRRRVPREPPVSSASMMSRSSPTICHAISCAVRDRGSGR
jgi:hypothetical protein